MDLEYLLRACWRRKKQIAALMVVLAVLVGIGGSKLKPLKYAATAQIVVYPNDLDQAASQVYAADPDRYVATQVATIDSSREIAAVAAQEGLTVPALTKMVSVSQTPGTDIIGVKVTSPTKSLSEGVSSAIANSYVTSVANAAASTINATEAALNAQITLVQGNIASTNQELAASVANPTLTASLNSALNAYTTQLLSLRTSLENVEAGNGSIATHIVSSGTSGVAVVGDSKKLLAIYGALLGLVIGLALVAITAGPSRSLENLDVVPEIDGVPVLGVTRSRRSRKSKWSSALHLPRLPGLGRGAVPSVSDLRIAQEITFTLRVKGQIAFLPIGPNDVERKVVGALERLLGKKAMNQGVVISTGQVQKAIVVIPLSAMLAGNVSESTLPTYVAVDIAHVRPKELTDLITTLRSAGAAVMGVVGIR
jgi:capsular polysaccharide biosynthesis protein